ncbi:peptidoglycan-binding protein [Halalkalibacter oceani]|uniref:peptidoglycan-binding protein n=1 Tax=Halalkalibacter oceani TaxID=1653776 RepID=UPI003396F069
MNLQTLIDRSQLKLDNVHPYIAERALEVVRKSYAEGIYVQITHGYRSIQEQDALYAQGRTTSGNIVTNARGGYSYHNFGLAVDFVVLDSNGAANWTVDSRWKRVGAIGESLSLEWGGNWSNFRDYPHLQYTFGLTTAQLRAGHRPPNTSGIINISPNTSGQIKLGSRGDKVKDVQQSLSNLGYSVGVFDGVFGDKTNEGVKQFQRDYGLVVDGIVGKQTLDAITKEEDKMKEKIEKLEKELSNLTTMIKQGASPEPSKWASEMWEELRINGYFDGKRPKGLITREESGQVINRLRKNLLNLIVNNQKELANQSETLESLEAKLKEIEKENS